MAITVLQSARGNATSGSSAPVALATTTTGSTLVVVMTAYNPAVSLTIASLAISAGSISAAAKFGSQAGLASTYTPIEAWVVPNIGGGTTPTLTVNLTGGTTTATDIAVFELSGMPTTTTPDGTASGANNAAASACTTPSITTTNPGSIVFGAFAPTNTMTTAGSGWTAGPLIGIRTGSLVEYAIETTTVTTAATGTQGGVASVYGSYIFALQPAGGGVTRPPQVIVIN
jgi:hypothetical protein